MHDNCPDKKFKSKLNRNLVFGFTYIELLMSMLIMFLVFGVGFANYRDFQRRQALEEVARLLAGDLRLAQERVRTGTKACPTSETLRLYRFKLVNPGVDKRTYHIEEVCSTTTSEIKRVTLQGAFFNPTFSSTIEFYPVGRGTNVPALTGGGNQLTLTLEHDSFSSIQKNIYVLTSGAIVE
jgi:type II secretory pathway pseudopilin PulG